MKNISNIILLIISLTTTSCFSVILRSYFLQSPDQKTLIALLADVHLPAYIEQRGVSGQIEDEISMNRIQEKELVQVLQQLKPSVQILIEDWMTSPEIFATNPMFSQVIKYGQQHTKDIWQSTKAEQIQWMQPTSNANQIPTLLHGLVERLKQQGFDAQSIENRHPFYASQFLNYPMRDLFSFYDSWLKFIHDNNIDIQLYNVSQLMEVYDRVKKLIPLDEPINDYLDNPDVNYFALNIANAIVELQTVTDILTARSQNITNIVGILGAGHVQPILNVLIQKLHWNLLDKEGVCDFNQMRQLAKEQQPIQVPSTTIFCTNPDYSLQQMFSNFYAKFPHLASFTISPEGKKLLKEQQEQRAEQMPLE